MGTTYTFAAFDYPSYESLNVSLTASDNSKVVVSGDKFTPIVAGEIKLYVHYTAKDGRQKDEEFIFEALMPETTTTTTEEPATTTTTTTERYITRTDTVSEAMPIPSPELKDVTVNARTATVYDTDFIHHEDGYGMSDFSMLDEFVDVSYTVSYIVTPSYKITTNYYWSDGTVTEESVSYSQPETVDETFSGTLRNTTDIQGISVEWSYNDLRFADIDSLNTAEIPCELKFVSNGSYVDNYIVNVPIEIVHTTVTTTTTTEEITTTTTEETTTTTEEITTTTTEETTTTETTTTTEETTTATTTVQPEVKLYIDSLPTKTVYEVGEQLDLSGGTFHAYARRSDGTEIQSVINRMESPNSDFTVDTSEFDSTRAGTYNIHITLDLFGMEVTESFTVTVNEPETVETVVTPYIELVRLPDRTEYELNEWYDLSGGEVRIGEIINDGENTTDTGRTVSMTDSSVIIDSSAYMNWQEGTYKIKIGYKSDYNSTDYETVYTEFELTVGKSQPAEEYPLGDVNNDGKIDASDASMILFEYARYSTSKPLTFTDAQKKAADIDGNSIIDSNDASAILKYYSYISTHEKVPFEEFI